MLTRHGKAEYVLVIPENCSKELLDTVVDMTQILKESTGADFQTVKSEEAYWHDKRIFIGRSIAMESIAKPKTPCNEERIYKSIGKDIVIYGGGRCGDVFAVYQFLMDTIGFRTLHFWGDSIIPRHPKLDLPKLNYDRVPSYIYRDLLQSSWNFYGCPTSSKAFRRMMFHSDNFDSVKRLTGCHTFNRFIPRGHAMAQRGEAFPPFKDKAYFKTNPEFFGMDNKGRRVDSMALCFSNKDLRRTLTENIETYVKYRKMTPDDDFVIDVGQDDIGGYFCRCPECIRFEEQYRAPAGAFYDYLIKDASPYFAERYPKMLIRFLTYGGPVQTEQPPAQAALPGGHLPSNLVPYLAYINGDFSRAWDTESNSRIHDALIGWGALAENMFVYYYPTTYSRPLTCLHLSGNILRMAKDYKEGASKLNIHYLYNDYSTDFFVVNAGFYGLQHYLMSRLSNDVSLNIDDLVVEYTDAIYGLAGRSMRAYFYELERLCEEDTVPYNWRIDCRFPHYVTPENLVRWQKNYDDMESLLEKYPHESLHLRCSRLNLDQLTMLMWNEIKQAGLVDGMDIGAIYKRYVDTAKEALERLYNPDCKNHISKAEREYGYDFLCKVIFGQARAFFQIGSGGRGKLPQALSDVPDGDLRYAVPFANKEPIDFHEDAVYGVALEGKCSQVGTANYGIIDGSRKYPDISKTVKNDSDASFQTYYIGRTKLTRHTELTAPCRPYYTRRYRGGMAGYARAYIGHLFNASAPDDEWDVYVSCRFQEDSVFTERFILAKVTDKTAKPAEEKPKCPVAVTILQSFDSHPSWKSITALQKWRDNLSGEPIENSPELKLFFVNGNLNLRFMEKNNVDSIEKQRSDSELWNDSVEFYLYGSRIYPMTQLTVASNGQMRALIYEMTEESNDRELVAKQTEIHFQGSFSSSCDAGEWTISMSIPKEILPELKEDEPFRFNAFRLRNGHAPVAWSPIYEKSFLSGARRFGYLYPRRIVMAASLSKHRFANADGTVFMNGNHGWQIQMTPPQGLDFSKKYRIGIELRAVAPDVPEDLTTRIGTYDTELKRITGYLPFPVNGIQGEQFVLKVIPAPVSLNETSFIYIGGFLPVNRYEGSIHVKQFIIEPVSGQ
ncbi:MAG: DUF4838 domain-containing protein [Victivallales bacterium]|nr:DUF4838 domain-containing protein [Victivallales bacterium]